MNNPSKLTLFLEWAIVLLLVFALSACDSTQLLDRLASALIPTTETTPAPEQTEVLDVQAPAPGRVEVLLMSASDSPAVAFFTVRDAGGVTIYKSGSPLARQQTIYLPPGEYTWTANAPVPTPPAGCFNVLENYGFSQEGSFTAVAEKIVIEVKLGMLVELCTPTPAPLVQKLAFVTDRDGNEEIYLVDFDGSDLTRLTENPAGDRNPAWSPDGQMIAFVSNRSGEDQIYIMNSDGSDVRQLTNIPGSKYQPLWSPNGVYIAYSNLIIGQDFQYDLNLISTDGLESISLLDLPSNIAPSSYSWSPDGQQIALDLQVSTPGQEAPRGACSPYLVNLDGTGFRLLGPKRDTLEFLACETDSKEVSWSRDGEWIAYVSTIYYQGIYSGEGLFKIRPDGSGMINLTPFPILGRDNDPFVSDISWSPSGQKFAFTSNLNDNGVGYYTMDSDGSQLVQIASQPYYLRWSPDERYFAYLVWDHKNNFDVYVMKTDGSEPKNITDHPANDHDFAWMPVGSVLDQEKAFDESQVRYVIADSQLGGVIDYYRQFTDQPGIAEAIRRWDAGVRVVNIDEFERKDMPGKGWQVVYAGSETQIDGTDVILTTDPTVEPKETSFYEPFDTDVFASGGWERSTSSVYVDPSNGWLRFPSDGSLTDLAYKEIAMPLPIQVEARMRLVSGGNDYRLPDLVIFTLDRDEGSAIYTTYDVDPRLGWILNIWANFSGVHTYAPPSEDVWMIVRAVIRADGGDLWAKFDNDADFTYITSSTWSVPDQMTGLKFVSPWDSPCDVDYIKIDASELSQNVMPSEGTEAYEACPGAPFSRLQVDMDAHLSTDLQEYKPVRRLPGLDSEIEGMVMPGAQIYILGGPFCEDGLVWWNIRVMGGSYLEGAIPEQAEEGYWLVPGPPDHSSLPEIDESQVRYVLADAQLGGVIDYYRQFLDQPGIAEAVMRWDAGIRVTNIDRFERQDVPDKGWQVVYKGTDNPIDAREVELTTDPPIQALINELDKAEIVYIPGGEFTMGLTLEQVDYLLQICEDCTRGKFTNSTPAHTVKLNDFYIYKHEVTNYMYRNCVNWGDCTPPKKNSSQTRLDYYGNPAYEGYPVVNIDWTSADQYCRRMGGRLPTEAEWEMAARGTDGRLFPWGDEAPNPSLANIDGYIGDTSQVGSYPSGDSPYGVSDMAGNVWEWVADWYQGDYFTDIYLENPTGPSRGELGRRSGRGGAYWINPGHSSSAYRDWYEAENTGSAIGFRCVMDTNS